MIEQNAIYYIAGLLEGEATFSSSGNSRYMELSMTDEDTVIKVHEMADKLGHVRGPYFREGKQPFWVWHVAEGKALARLLCAIAPLMSLRRRDAIMELANKLSKTSKQMIAKPCEVCGKVTQPISTRSASTRMSVYCSISHRDIINNKRNNDKKRLANVSANS